MVSDSICSVMGWGDTLSTGHSQVLKEVIVPIVPNSVCNLPDWRNCQATACMICAGDDNMSPCEGDSGGPLFCSMEDGSIRLSGIYSYGRCGIHSNNPAIFTSVGPYYNWIIENIYES